MRRVCWLLPIILVATFWFLIPWGCSRDVAPMPLQGRWLRSVGTDQLVEAIGVTVGAHAIYVSDPKQGIIARFGSDDVLLPVWKGDALARPMHLSSGYRGRIYVPDYLRDRVVVLDEEGLVVQEFGAHGTAPGQFDSPAGIAVDRDGSIYVADFNNHRVQKFDRQGAFLRAWGEKGHLLPGDFYYPTDVAVGPDGSVFVADAYNHRIQVFTPDGEHLRTIGAEGSDKGEFNVPVGIAVDAKGRLFVADQFNHRIQVFDRDGRWIGGFGSEGSGEGAFDRPNDVAFDDGAGVVYVADFGNGRVQAFSLESGDSGAGKESDTWKGAGASRSSLGRWWY